MKKFKDFRPTSMDSAGVGSEGQEDWLVLPTSRTRDTGPLEESNFAAALEQLGGESDTVQVHRFGHWGPGWFEIIVVHPSRESDAEEIEKSLEDYPVLDAEDMSRRETEAAAEDWKNWGENEFQDVVKGLVELDDEQETMLESYVDLTALWQEVANELSWSEQSEGDSTIFNFEEAEKYLSEHIDLIWSAIDAAYSSPAYVATQKKMEDTKLDRWHKATRGYNPPSGKERVIFRKWPNGEIVALFPEILADHDGHVTSYMHVGQHGAADLYHVLLKTVPASRAEYAELKKELEQIGYELDVIDDWPDLHNLRGRSSNPPFGESLYGYDGNGYSIGDRVELHPATDMWMRGARYGTVVGVKMSSPEAYRAIYGKEKPRYTVRVRLDKMPNKVFTALEDQFRPIH